MIEFFDLVEGTRKPQRADKSALGTSPTNGFRFCEPLRTANSFGWYVFLPVELSLIWDGHDFRWSIDEGDSWYPLYDAIQYPNFSNEFDLHAPEEVKGYAPPFLTVTNDHDVIQIWTGYIVRTVDDLALQVRAPVNINSSAKYAVLEGVVQTNWWFGPLFANIKILQPNAVINFGRRMPFVQLSPFSNNLYSQLERTRMNDTVPMAELTDEDWKAYHQTVVRKMTSQHSLGDYAVESRRRAKGQKAT